ncbi:STAS/SEC14 domain-containing protein [candidate division WOR-3 bacterium]|nr:STAS/SEC14 domain-containing protein [candidate division WOR-3 bacterium]
MKHQVFYDKKTRILRLSFIGKVEIGELQELVHKLNSIPGEYKLYTLVNLTEMKMPNWDRQTRETLASGLNQEDYPRVAIVGASPVIRMLARMFTPFLNRKQAIAFFETEEEATAWLKLL